MEAKYNPYGENSIRTKCEEFICDQCYKAGIREVVEWMMSCMLREHCDTKDKSVFCRDYRVYDGEWQAKLKDWGVK